MKIHPTIPLFLSLAAASALAAAPDPDSHAAHAAADPAAHDPAMAGDFSKMRETAARLEKSMGTADPGAGSEMADMEGMPTDTAEPKPAMDMGMEKKDMGGMKMGGMGNMEKQGGMGMMKDKEPMQMMRMKKMKMAGMMGMGPMDGAMPGDLPPSALPGFPGASHLYHLGATGFFLDHQSHISLSTEQSTALNRIREESALAGAASDRAIEQAEQELWTLTSTDQPDAAAIEKKATAIGRLGAEKRIAFIRAVGAAAELLTDEQRRSLTGLAPAAPAAPAMDDM